MKRVALIRHAKSSWDHPLLTDFDRPLNGRGQKDAPQMALVLEKYAVSGGKWISSPAKRALTTAHLMCKALGKPIEQVYADNRLYHAWTDTLLTLIHEQESGLETLLLFAHNPGLTEMANRIAPVRLDNLPTCGIFIVQFATRDWSTIQYGTGEFIALDYPKNHR